MNTFTFIAVAELVPTAPEGHVASVTHNNLDRLVDNK